jgi:hypothetical protein
MHAPQQGPPKPLANRIGEDLGRMVYTAEGPEWLFPGTSVPMHSVLATLGENLKPTNSERFVIAPSLSQWYSAYLHMRAR